MKGKGVQGLNELLSLSSCFSLHLNTTEPVSLKVVTLLHPHLSAGSRLIHHELLHVHLLGSVLCLPSCLSGQGVCSLRMRLWDPRGKENVAFSRPFQVHLERRDV